MNKFLIIITLTILLKPILPVIDYIVNYDFIKNELCLNKSKPKLKCNGKCHLFNEMAKESDSERPISDNKKHNFKPDTEVLFFNEINLPYTSHFTLSNPSSLNSFYSDTYSYLFNSSFFHPPTFIS